ncbi:MAG: Ni/Fe hydrogenase subunit alpha [Candidatus Eisenbacteria bacterium]|nr:Ni/Fe hydrogenase subunit alpha [Candidatus Eisenbacteria bacterium]
MNRVTIDPITRLEGHGRIEIFLDDKGNVANTYLQIPELRGFEKFCEGRPVEEVARITPRICGVCPEAHHMAATKAVDAVFHVDPPSPAKKLRELLYSAFYTGDHATHFYILAGPDFVVGPTASPAERNILGLIAKVGIEAGKTVIQTRAMAHEIVSMLGGKAIHPVCGIPGGVSKGLNAEEQKRCIEIAKGFVEFGKFTFKVFEDVVLKNKAYVDLILSDAFTHKTYYMGLVDKNNKVNFYDGQIRVVDTEGKEFARFSPSQYLDNIAEHVEPWTYLKFPYLKKVGWKGLVDGQDSGVYRAAPLARLNVSDGMATPLAQAEYDKMYKTLGGKPVHQTLATHWARIIELMYAAERTLELAQDPEITSPNIRIIPKETPTEGVGVVEAPRGILYHHYQTDEKGMVKKANLIVGTTNNYAAICMSIKKAAQGLIKAGTAVSEGLLNQVEMAFRAYDPCFGCATHDATGRTLLEVRIYDHKRELVDVLKSE